MPVSSPLAARRSMLRLYVRDLGSASVSGELDRRLRFPLRTEKWQLDYLGSNFLPNGFDRDLHLQLGSRL